MSDETKKPKERKHNYVEAGIIKIAEDLYNVRVSRRMFVSDHQPHKQFFRRKNNVRGLNQARRIKRELMDELAQEAMKYDGNDVKWSTVREDYHAYLEERHREETLQASTMRNAIQTFDKYTRAWDEKWLSSITPPFLNAFITDEKLKSETEPATRQSLLKFIRGALKRQVILGRIKYDPTAGLIVRAKKKQSDPISLTHNDVVRLIKYARDLNQEWSDAWADVYEVGYLSGARSGELWSMTWSNVILDGADKKIKIKYSYDWKTEKTKPTKGKKDRIIPLSPTLEKVLRKLKEKYPNSEYVLPRIPDWKRGEGAEIIRGYLDGLKTIVELETKGDDLEKINFHSLRGSFIVNLLLKNTPLIKVMALCGHEDIATTRRYLRSITKELAGSTDVLTLEEDNGNVIEAQFNGDKKRRA